MAIQWYVYAITASIFFTAFYILRKKALMKAHAMNFESARTLSVAVLCLFLIPFIDLNIRWQVLFIVYSISLISTVGILFASKAFRHEAISLIAPLGNVRPAFVAVIAFLFLGESLGLKEIIGILILLIAAYLLESDHQFSDFLAPIKHFFRDKYSLFFVFAVLLFGIIDVVNKFMITNYINIFTLFFLIWIFTAFNFNIIHAYKYGIKDTVVYFKEAKFLPIIIALLSMGGNLLFLQALSMAYVSLVAPVMLLSTLFIVVIGGGYFHERFLLFRLGASAIMLIGAYLIII
jgi:drug/metabolite transporter (DMT)-like permease